MNLSLELTAEETAMLEKCAVRNNISTAEFIKIPYWNELKMKWIWKYMKLL